MILIGWGSYGLDALFIREEKKEALLDQINKGVAHKDVAAAMSSGAPVKTRLPAFQLTSRRTILRVFGAAGVIVVGNVLAVALHAISGAGNAPSANPGTGTTTGTSGGGGTGGGGGGTGSSGNVIGNKNNIPLNSATTFNVAGNNDPGVLIHNPDDTFVAYDAVCTHVGCTVAYNSKSKHLECPCHGSVFDPASQGKVLTGPARAPLSNIKITISSSGDISQG
jgi:Rieske Fe-S protein